MRIKTSVEFVGRRAPVIELAIQRSDITSWVSFHFEVSEALSASQQLQDAVTEAKRVYANAK
jgi:uncharacterized membrane protein